MNLLEFVTILAALFWIHCNLRRLNLERLSMLNTYHTAGEYLQLKHNKWACMSTRSHNSLDLKGFHHLSCMLNFLLCTPQQV